MRFLGLGIDINATNNAGETPLFFFIGGFPGDIKDPQYGGMGKGKGKDEDSAWKIFVENGADFEARDHAGRGLLHVVAGSPGYAGDANYGVVRFKRLMDEMGMDPMAQDTNMRTSLDVAAAYGGEGFLGLFEGEKSGNKRARRS